MIVLSDEASKPEIQKERIKMEIMGMTDNQ